MKVTVLVPCYNSEQFLSSCIESILSQSYPDFEVLLIDDGSIDNTLSIIKNYSEKYKNIRYISHENCGMGESLNKGMSLAKGEFIVRMDSDDIMLPNRISLQVEYMEKNIETAVLSCLAYYIDENDRIIGKTYSDLIDETVSKKYLQNNEPIGLLHPGVIFRKKIIQELGGYRGQFWPAEDIDLWNRVIEKGYIIITLQNVLMKYRIHGGSIITSKFIDSRKKYEWVRESMWSRRKGMDEPSWEDYLEKLNKMSFTEKLNWNRKAFAKNYYRAAGFDFARNRYLLFVFHLFISVMLQPMYVFKKIIKQSTI